jgi:FkbM family methyltransferase
MLRLIKKYTSKVRDEGFISASIQSLIYLSLISETNKIALYARGYTLDQDKDGDSYIKRHNGGKKFYLADKSVLTEFFSNRNENYYEGAINLDETDVVLNIGAHIGSTVLYPAERCDMVYAVEPNPETVEILEKNTAYKENIEIIQAGCWSESGDLELNFGRRKNDDSFITPDDGGTGKSRIVKTYSIDDLVNKINDDVSFLKVEAEGAEPEVLRGMQECKIEKVVVKVDEERDGESPIVDVIRILDDMEYNIDCKYPYVYGRMKSS